MIGSRRNKVLGFFFSLSLLGFCNTLLAVGHLEFFLNKDRVVIQCGAFDGMQFWSDPETYIGKDILEIVPLTSQNKLELLRSFSFAWHAKEMVKIPYELGGKTYIAEIRPIVFGGPFSELLYLGYFIIFPNELLYSSKIRELAFNVKVHEQEHVQEN